MKDSETDAPRVAAARSRGRGWFTVEGSLDGEPVTVTWANSDVTGDTRAVAHIHGYVAERTVFAADPPGTIY